ncbi:MAG: fused MFS/spermidine synthase [Myxococcota bacterium]|nr:fused MFS/spermidine synthase [Myxococcota bacterium]
MHPRKPRVEVKKEGEGLALEVEGTFASYYQPGSPVTGSVWDAIAAPVLALPPGRRKEILILGVAGGSAARVVRAIAKDAHITGVELSPEVIEAAREHFDLDALGLDLVIGDALEFLREDDRRFDLILEDVFVGVGRSVHKPGWLPEPGHELAKARLEEGGLLVSNTLDETDEITAAMRGRFPGVLRVEVEDYENIIVVGGPDTLSGGELRRAVLRNPVLGPSVSALSFRSVQTGSR